ncbi:MAG: hypothetical protein SGPRY_015082, partial [Prymnesium sp.]
WYEECQTRADGFIASQSGNPLKKMEEPSFFFKMSRFQERLMQHLRDNPTFAVPLQDLSVSRTTFDWGIPVPNASDHVMYVWFDALSNYLTGIGYDASKTLEENQASTNARFWPA